MGTDPKSPGSTQYGAQGMTRLDFLSGDFQQTADAEEKVDHMSNEKACKVSLDSENRQQEEKQSNIQGTGEMLMAMAHFCCPRPLVMASVMVSQ